MHLSELAKSGEFIITCELASPKGVNIQNFLDQADQLKSYVHAINIGDNPRATMRAGSWALCHLLKSRDIEPVMELVTRDRNRIALQSDMLGAAILGIENIILSDGHDPSVGDHTEATSVHDLNCISLAGAAKTLTGGHDMTGHALDGAPSLCLGIMANPGLEPLEKQLDTIKEAVAQGAQFIQTQPVYDPSVLERFVNSIHNLDVTIIVGHMMLKSVSMASFINSNLEGVTVPDAMIKQLEGQPRNIAVETSLQMSANLIKAIKPLCHGIHFIPAGWERYVPRIIETLADR